MRDFLFPGSGAAVLESLLALPICPFVDSTVMTFWVFLCSFLERAMTALGVGAGHIYV